jgi:hypothetical protein
MLHFNLISDFRLRNKKEYRDMDSFIDNTIRKNNFNSELAEKVVDKYLKDQLRVLLSWVILLFSLSLINSLLPFIFDVSNVTKVFCLITVVSSFIVFFKFRKKLNEFNFNKGIIMSLLNISKQVSD